MHNNEKRRESKKPAIAVCSFLPMPLDRGDPIRVAMMLSNLALYCDLTVLAVKRDETIDEDVAHFREMLPQCAVEVFSPRGIRRGFWPMLSRWFRATRSRTPSWIKARESVELARFLFEATRRFEGTVFLLGEAAGIYAKEVPLCVHTHWDKSNVLTASIDDEMRQTRSGLRKIRLRMVKRLSVWFERRTIRKTRTVSVTSKEEADRLSVTLGRQADFVLPSAVELLAEVPAYNAEASGVAWLGSLNYAPNVDGLVSFIECGLPVLVEAGLELHVVGSGSSPAVASLEGRQGLRLCGYVDDLSTLPATCRAAVVPLWAGAGVKLKTITLMGLGLPCAATPVAMEGVDPSASLVVTDSSEELARTIVNASPCELEEARSRAQDLLIREHSAGAFGERVRAMATSFC